MKNFKFIIIIAVAIFIVYVPNIVFAVKMIPFEDPSLQPMPIPDVKPNISKSVNSNPEQEKINNNLNGIPEIKTPNQSEQKIETTKNTNGASNFYTIIWIIISLPVLGLIILAFLFLKSKK